MLGPGVSSMAWESCSCCWLSSCPVQVRSGSHSTVTCAAALTCNLLHVSPVGSHPCCGCGGLSLPPASVPFPVPGAPHGEEGGLQAKLFFVAHEKGGNEHLHEGICAITRARSKPGPLVGKSHCWLVMGTCPSSWPCCHSFLPACLPRVPVPDMCRAVLGAVSHQLLVWFERHGELGADSSVRCGQSKEGLVWHLVL